MSEIATELKALNHARKVCQKQRVAFGLRLDALEREDRKANPKYIEIMHRFRSLEDEITESIKDTVDYFADESEILRILLDDCYGVGPVSASIVVAEVIPKRAPTISSLWRYSGYGVGEDGLAERPKKGERRPYNAGLKIALRLIGENLIRATSPYRQDYDEARKYYESNRDWSKGRVHNASLRKVIKLWLSHLWLTWRRLEGLPTSDPYVVASDEGEAAKHSHVITPVQRGWPDVSKLDKAA